MNIVFLQQFITGLFISSVYSKAVDEINAFKRRVTIIDFWRESNYDQIIYAIHVMMSIFDKTVREFFIIRISAANWQRKFKRNFQI